MAILSEWIDAQASYWLACAEHNGIVFFETECVICDARVQSAPPLASKALCPSCDTALKSALAAE